ncbi:hypothetical protein [Streptomyces anulatus]|uniref:hypothetical protein n=1 Tax=Streptomyces anulatus TaxID=1892 RepID=UPI00386D4729
MPNTPTSPTAYDPADHPDCDLCDPTNGEPYPYPHCCGCGANGSAEFTDCTCE